MRAEGLLSTSKKKGVISTSWAQTGIKKRERKREYKEFVCLLFLRFCLVKFVDLKTQA